MEKLFALLLIKRHERGHVLYFVLVYLLLGVGMALGRGTGVVRQ